MNNTLTEAEKGKDKAKETDTDKYTDKDISKTKEKGQENTAGEKESVGGGGINTGQENATAVDREDKYTDTIPEKTKSEGRSEGEPEERNTGSEKPSGGSNDKVDSQGPDNSLNTVENKEPEVAKPPEKEEEEGNQDTNLEIGKTDVTEIVVIKDKGQEEKERKEEQVNGKRDPDKVGPNDTKLRPVVTEGDNTVEIFEKEMTKNNTVIYDTKDTKKENNSIDSPEAGRKIIPTRVNITQYTMYRAGGEESGKPKEKPTIHEDNTDEDSAEKTKEELEREREEKEKEKEKEVNQSFTGKRLIEEKSKQTPIPLLFRVHPLYPPPAEKSCPPLPRLYHGYHQALPGVEPETVEFFCNHSYAVSGDARRTCQPDGTWSGKQPLCVRGTVSVVMLFFFFHHLKPRGSCQKHERPSREPVFDSFLPGYCRNMERGSAHSVNIKGSF